MHIPSIRGVIRRTRAILGPDHDRFLKKATGVIHVGANVGPERDLYRRCGLRVVWVEPIPEVFETLRSNIESYGGQLAFRYLVTDEDDVEYEFHIASNYGASSSILDMGMHKEIWPEVTYDRTIRLRSTTLPSLLERERINPTDYDALVMDTQGSEHLVLKGAVPILRMFRFIKTEVPDFESYTDCCQLDDIRAFLEQHGFREISRHRLAEHPDGGRYYDIVFERVAITSAQVA